MQVLKVILSALPVMTWENLGKSSSSLDHPVCLVASPQEIKKMKTNAHILTKSIISEYTTTFKIIPIWNKSQGSL